ncbi:hypothetical protein GCM10011358_15730 [Sinisalibacter lacisalsi]|uniref:Uncharacterized protein n=1 Tax=Sinisalibacter lacisalsi TaxID=1526570 RepID=A0ABQ1QLI5_9RHOB|nr:hypothetical protein GCM10011358_15730 [Sinisalibacter lacisalsi]
MHHAVGDVFGEAVVKAMVLHRNSLQPRYIMRPGPSCRHDLASARADRRCGAYQRPEAPPPEDDPPPKEPPEEEEDERVMRGIV